MKLVVSNIAWSNEEEVSVAQLLQRLGVKYVEIAPTKMWNDPTLAPHKEIEAYRAFWKSYGIEIVAFQSMLYNRPDLNIFPSEINRQETLSYLKEFIELAASLGVSALVFGSPKNRQRGDMSFEQAKQIAIPFFSELGQAASAANTVFCIEPNAKQYNCDFITNAEEGINLVKEVNNPGFALHLDMGCMTLAGDDVAKSIKDAQAWLKHFHISSPMLQQVEDQSDVHHVETANALRDISYDGFVSIEMRSDHDNLARIEKAVHFAQSVYSS